jgi:formylglycine-generating enzyme required for sulfatase activity
MRALIALALVAMLAPLGALPAWAEKRIALVIGNAAYKETAPLTNTGNDASDLADALGRLDFDVMRGVDLDKRSMERLIRDFDRKLAGADIALFFYAGHGLQVGGQNFLVPIDARLTTEGDLDFESVPLNLVLKRMEREAKTSIVLLDACRDNPLARNLARRLGTRSANIGRGLSRIEAGIGTLIGFSTQPGNYALDGDGRNSPYTRALLDEIEQPGREMLATLAAVRGRVVKVTNGKQVPWEHTSLLGPVVLKPEAKQYTGARSSWAGSPSYVNEAAQMWKLVDSQNDIALFEAFRKQFGASSPVYDQLAANRIAGLKRAQAEEARLAALKAEEEKKQAQAEAARLAALKAEEDRKRAQAEAERLAALKVEEDKKRAQAEAARLAALKVEEDKKRAQAEAARLAAVKAEEDKKRAQAEAARLAAAKAEEDKKRAQAEEARLAALKAEEDKKRAQAERQRLAALQQDEALRAEPPRKTAQEPVRRDPALSVEPGSGRSYRDRLADGQPCPSCPELMVVPEGEFLMGSTAAEIAAVSAERPDLAKYFNWEGPQRKVSIARRFAVGRSHVTRGEFAAFVAATGHEPKAGCYVHEGGEWKLDGRRHWRSPGFEQTDRHPVICVSWTDANAYADWLSKLTGRRYRLLSEAEAEYVARATTRPAQMPRYFFGEDAKNLCGFSNGANRTAVAALGWERQQVAPCESGYIYTAPVASFQPNAWGLHDVHGNVWSWTADCWNESLAEATADGSARTAGDCTRRVVRGGSWANGPRDLRSAVRDSNAIGEHSGNLGFRVARDIEY